VVNYGQLLFEVCVQFVYSILSYRNLQKFPRVMSKL